MAHARVCPTADGSVLTVAAGTIQLLGWSVRESGAAAAVTIDLKEGSASGRVLATIVLATSGTDTQWLGDSGIVCNSTTLYADLTGTGVPTGAIWIA